MLWYKPIRLETITLLSLLCKARCRSNGPAGARTVADMITNYDKHNISLTVYLVGRLIKKLGLVSYRLQKHVYKKAEKEHIAIPNFLQTVRTESAQSSVVRRCQICPDW